MTEFIELIKTFFTTPVYVIGTIFLLITVIISVFFSKKIIGKAGEHWTKKELIKLPENDYRVLNDIMIKVNDYTHQIDHIVVSKYGIFVIETKQYNGYITGNKYDKYWVRHLQNKKLYYLNPIRQNYTHVKALIELLNIEDNKVFNIACITSNGKFNIKHDGELVYVYELLAKIESYKEEIIDNVDQIVYLIESNNIIDKKERKEHIKNLNKHKNDKDTSKCPKCGANLVDRYGKNGYFIGCSNYPKCKYTRNITDDDCK